MCHMTSSYTQYVMTGYHRVVEKWGSSVFTCMHNFLHFQSTFYGRLKHFLDIVDPRTLFTSEVLRLLTVLVSFPVHVKGGLGMRLMQLTWVIVLNIIWSLWGNQLSICTCIGNMREKKTNKHKQASRQTKTNKQTNKS